ncbi:MAG: lysine-2,3-aminomutase-like protein [Parvularcula sp.]
MTIRTVDALKAKGLIAPTAALDEVAHRYAIAITPHLAELVDRQDPNDPIAAQFIPSNNELKNDPLETNDPIGDKAHEPVPGIVHRYPDRVLLKAVAVCPVYCRFCFRREMVGPGKDKNLTSDQLEAALDYIRQDTNIWEVILTGGDPFMLSPQRVETLTKALGAIPHVKIIRWHTRMPIAEPARITQRLAQALTAPEKPIYVAVHINHPRELTSEVSCALARLADEGIPLLGQTVLLRDVNDTFETLSALMRRLVECRVKPYYLHQLDYAPGTSHFRVPLPQAQQLVQRLRDEVSGLCQPHFVIDIPGGVSKAIASASDVAADGKSVRGRDGKWRPYP